MGKHETLFITEAQLAERMGLTTDQLKAAMHALNQAGFPMPDPLIAGRRYWPACKAFLDRRYGLASSSGQANPGLDGEERWS